MPLYITSFNLHWKYGLSSLDAGLGVKHQNTTCPDAVQNVFLLRDGGGADAAKQRSRILV